MSRNLAPKFDLRKENEDLYNLERAEYLGIKSSLSDPGAKGWHKDRLAEVTKASGRAAIGGYWPHIMRNWKPSIAISSDGKHVCSSWAAHSSPSYAGYYCVVCGFRHPDNDKSSPDTCEWAVDAYYIGFFDYLNRTKKLLFFALGKSSIK